MRKMFYLAAPYTGTKKQVEERVKKYGEIDAELMSNGYFTCSPLLKHFILHLGDLPSDWNYWKEYSETMLANCSAAIVIKMEGWEESPGVRGEIDFCKKHGILIHYYDPETGSIAPPITVA